MAKALASIVIEDYDGERSSVRPNLQDADAGATNYGSLATDLDEIKDSILTVITGEVRYAQLGVQFPESVAAVTDNQAAREGKWLVTMRDTTQYMDSGNLINNPGYMKLFSFEIPTADRTLLPTNSDTVDLTEATTWAPFVASMEANCRSPYNRSAGAGVTPTQVVVEIKYVGRNI
jgi:hypothetical protein